MSNFRRSFCIFGETTQTMLDRLNTYYDNGLLYKQTHPTLPLTIWNYTEKVQFEDLWDEVTLMCRGLVTDNDGNFVADVLCKINVRHYVMPHPSPLNRNLNHKWWVELMLKDCKDYLK